MKRNWVFAVFVQSLHSNENELELEMYEMKYINAEQVFPEEVLKEIRKYVPEGYIYVPKQSVRKQWGSVSGSRQKLKKRNHEILLAYQTGKSVEELAQEYYLTTSSIYSILKQAI